MIVMVVWYVLSYNTEHYTGNKIDSFMKEYYHIVTFKQVESEVNGVGLPQIGVWLKNKL